MRLPGQSLTDLLDGRYLDKWASARPAPVVGERDPLIFVHVPKTAGLAIREHINGWFRCEDGHSWPDKDRGFASWLDRSHKKREALLGHVTHEHVQQALAHPIGFTFATWIRHPVARALSHYKYCMSELHDDHREFREAFPTMQKWLDWGGMSRNFQARTLVGDVDSADECIEKVHSTYHFVGLSEAFNASMSLFALAWGLKFKLPKARVNAAVDRQPQSLDIPADVEDQLRAQNPIDLALHDHVRSLYESELESLVSWALRA